MGSSHWTTTQNKPFPQSCFLLHICSQQWEKKLICSIQHILSDHQMITKWSNYIILSKILKYNFERYAFKCILTTRSYLVQSGCLWVKYFIEILIALITGNTVIFWILGNMGQLHKDMINKKSSNHLTLVQVSFQVGRYCWLFEGPGPRSQYQDMQRKFMNEAGARLF